MHKVLHQLGLPKYCKSDSAARISFINSECSNPFAMQSNCLIQILGDLRCFRIPLSVSKRTKNPWKFLESVIPDTRWCFTSEIQMLSMLANQISTKPRPRRKPWRTMHVIPRFATRVFRMAEMGERCRLWMINEGSRDVVRNNKYSRLFIYFWHKIILNLIYNTKQICMIRVSGGLSTRVPHQKGQRVCQTIESRFGMFGPTAGEEKSMTQQKTRDGPE